MAEIIDFAALAEEPDISEMDREELQTLLKQLRGKIEQLDEREPRNMDSEEYELWGEEHEALEDLVDDILDRLEEMGS